jgi:flagellar hook-associated protein 3 FlgL
MNMRMGSANLFDNTLVKLSSRQAGLADLQEKLSAGKKVLHASDDPAGAAQAERALTRATRVQTEQRALGLQRNAMATAESTLGDASGALQTLRDLVISAGNAALSPANRSSIAQQITTLRDQLFGYANQQDSNGIPLFGGLGSAGAPFTDAASGVVFNGIAGQHASTPVSIPALMDGQAVWMDVPTGNGVFTVGLGGANTGTAWTDVGQVLNPAAVTGHNYTLSFSVVAGVTTYNVSDTTSATTVATAQPYVDGKAINFDGLSFTAHGVPVNGDTLQLAPSTRTDLFNILDSAINSINNPTASPHALTQATTLALAQIDAGMSRIQSARGIAGDALNRADIIDKNQQTKTQQLAADRSRAEDMDMVQGISDFQNQQTGYDAALKTYAQVQRLSLFNYLS